MLKILVTIGGIQAAAIAVNLVRSKLVAVLLGPAGVGVVSVVDQAVQLVAYVSAFSLPYASVRFLARSHSRGEAAFARTYASLFRLLCALTVAGAVLSAGALLWRPGLLGPGHAAYRAYLLPALVSAPAMALQGYFASVLAAAKRSATSSLISLVTACAYTASAAAGVLVGGVQGYYWANLLAGVLLVLVVTAYLRRTLHLSATAAGSGVWREIRNSPDIIGFSLISAGASLMLSLSYFVARLTVLGHAGETEAGLLQAAIALAAALGLVLSPMNGLYLTPILNRDMPRAEKVRAALEFQRKQVLIITLLALPISLFPRLLVSLLYSPAFAPVAQIVFLFVLAQCLVLLGGVYQALLIGLDDLKAYGLITAAGYGSLAALAWLLGPRLGLAGVGLAFLGGSVVAFALSFGRLVGLSGLTLPPRLWGAMAYGLAAVLVGGALFSQAAPWQPLLLAARAAVLVAVAAGLLTFLDAEERAEFQRLVGNIARRLPAAAIGDPLARTSHLPQRGR
jgi:antigen flippase